MRQSCGLVSQGVFQLAQELVLLELDAVDAKKKVAWPFALPLYSHERASAGAYFHDEARSVAGSETYQGKGAGAQGGEDQFSGFAFGEVFAGFRVHDFEQEMVLAYVESLVVFALERHGRAGDLAQAVVHPGLGVEAFLPDGNS